MAGPTLADTSAVANFYQLADADGRLVLLPTATVDALRGQGLTSIAITVSLIPSAPPRAWITLTEAARLHCDDVDGMNMNHAKVKISRALERGKLPSEGVGTARRLEPNAFDAWRLKERERCLAKTDDDDVEPDVVERVERAKRGDLT